MGVLRAPTAESDRRLEPAARVSVAASGRGDRLLSLDVMRGATVAGMVLVNNPGSWTDGYGFLAHAEWNGCTVADLIFPFFLLMVGTSISLSLDRCRERASDRAAALPRIVRRTIFLFAIGLLLNGFAHPAELSTLRYFGVLQRIALCSLVASAIFLRTGVRGQVGWAVALLAVYWLVIELVPVPGHGSGVLEPHGNLVGYLDTFLFRGHLYHGDFDPEGLLSTLPAVATTLLGVLAGQWLTSSAAPSRKTAGLLAAGAALAIAGGICDRWLPINKQLWTSSFVLLTGGLGSIVLGTCYAVVDAKGYRRMTAPLVILGTNALAMYVLSSLAAQMMEICGVTTGDGTSASLRFYIYAHLFAPWAGVLPGSLLYAATCVLLWIPPMAFLYRRGILLRV